MRGAFMAQEVVVRRVAARDEADPCSNQTRNDLAQTSHPMLPHALHQRLYQVRACHFHYRLPFKIIFRAMPPYSPAAAKTPCDLTHGVPTD